MKSRKASYLASFLSLVVFSGQANAGILTFFNQAAYQAAVNARLPLQQRTETFEAFPNGSIGSPSNFSTFTNVGTTTYSVVSNINFAVSNATTPTKSLGLNDPIDPTITEDLTITIGTAGRGLALQVISDATLGGINGDFLVNANGADGSGATNVELSTANATATPLGGGFNSYFFGFVADTAADSLTDSIVSTTNAINGYRIDNVQIAAVPEPSSIALLAVAGVFGLIRRRTPRSK